MSKKESEFDKKLKRLSKKTDLEIFRQNMGFEVEIKKLEGKIDKLSGEQLRDFDNSKDSLSKYLEIGSTDSFVERYRKKLDNL